MIRHEVNSIVISLFPPSCLSQAHAYMPFAQRPPRVLNVFEIATLGVLSDQTLLDICIEYQSQVRY